MSFKSFYRKNKRMAYFVGGIFLFIIFMTLLQPLLLTWIKSDPDLYVTYQFVMGQLFRHSLLWLFIISFLGSLFFIALATDFIFLYYILRSSNPLTFMPVYFLGVMLGRIANYWIGYLFSGYVTHKILKEDYQKLNSKYSKIEGSALFFANFIPFFPTEFLIAFLGTIKYSFWKFLAYNGVGKFIKLVLLLAFMEYIMIYHLNWLNWSVFHFFRVLIGRIIPV